MENLKVFFKKNIKAIVLVVIVIIVAVIATVILNGKNSTVTFNVTPHDAIVAVGDNRYGSQSTEKFKSGHYTVEISKPGLETKTIELDLGNFDTVKIDAYLAGNDNDFSYYETDKESFYTLREYNATHEDAALNDFILSYDKKAAIKDILPKYYMNKETGDSYYIFYKEDNASCEKIYCIEIGATQSSYAPIALKAITDNGFNPDDYQIIYTFDNE